MDKKIIMGLLSLILIVLAIAILIPGGGEPDPNPKLPWNITVDESGKPSVLGITLGQTTLEAAQRNFKEPGEVSLFVSPEGDYFVEAYFERLYLSGIRAAIILSLDVDDETLKAIFKRGARIERMDTGNRKVTLRSDDIDTLAQSTFRHMTYIPSANLDPELIKRRFGEPDKMIQEANSEAGTTHWVYLDKGLDIAHNLEGKEIFQYVIPAEMDRIVKPLEAAPAN